MLEPALLNVAMVNLGTVSPGPQGLAGALVSRSGHRAGSSVAGPIGGQRDEAARGAGHGFRREIALEVNDQVHLLELVVEADLTGASNPDRDEVSNRLSGGPVEIGRCGPGCTCRVDREQTPRRWCRSP